MRNASTYDADLYNYALRLLAQRDYSKAGLQVKLQQRLQRSQKVVAQDPGQDNIKNDGGDVVQHTIDKLVQQSLISDTRFIESYIRAKQASGYGPHRIILSLRNKGIDQELLEDYLDSDDSVWIDAATEQLIKKHRIRNRMNDQKGQPISWQERTKLCRFLSQRGYDSEQINQAFSRFQALQESVQYEP